MPSVRPGLGRFSWTYVFNLWEWRHGHRIQDGWDREGDRDDERHCDPKQVPALCFHDHAGDEGKRDPCRDKRDCRKAENLGDWAGHWSQFPLGRAGTANLSRPN